MRFSVVEIARTIGTAMRQRSVSSAILASALAVMLAACSSVKAPPPFKPALAADKATVYLYRTAGGFQSNLSPNVYVNGEKQFSLRHSYYSLVNLPRGDHEFEIRHESTSLGVKESCITTATRKLSVVEGKDYYLRYTHPIPTRAAPTALPGLLGAITIADQFAWTNQTCRMPPAFGEADRDQALRDLALIEHNR